MLRTSSNFYKKWLKKKKARLQLFLWLCHVLGSDAYFEKLCCLTTVSDDEENSHSGEPNSDEEGEQPKAKKGDDDEDWIEEEEAHFCSRACLHGDILHSQHARLC